MSSVGKIILLPANLIINAGITPHFVAKFALFMAVLLLGTISIGRFLRMLLKIPAIAGQIIGGIVLGPSLLNLTAWSVFNERVVFSDLLTCVEYSFVSSDLFCLFVLLISTGFTVTYLLWIAGHETDIQDILMVGVTATGAGIFGALIPIVVIAAWLVWFNAIALVTAIGIGLIFAATSVSIPVAMFFSQKKMHLQSSKATLGAAIIDDIFAVILLGLFMMGLQIGVFGGDVDTSLLGHASGVLDALGFMLLAFLVFGLVGYFGMVPFIAWIRQRGRIHLIAATATIFMLGYFAFSELIGGLAGITGAYFAGMFHRMADKKHYAVKAISPYVNAILLPIFLGSIGLQINLKLLTWSDWQMVFFLTILAIITKFMGTYLATGISNIFSSRNKYRWSNLDSYIFGAAMVARGEVGLVVATLLKGVGILDFSAYIVSVVVIVLTTIISPMLLMLGFKLADRYLGNHIDQEYKINIGRFKALGTLPMFNIILGIVEAAKGVSTTIELSEGRKIANLEGLGVKIIYTPEIGIIFEGKREQIDEILHLVQRNITEEVEHIIVQ
jgi:Kef-type K+ transport system membrane component KefB